MPELLRVTVPQHNNYLCGIFTSTSASLERLVRCVTTGIVYRTWEAGVRQQMISLLLQAMNASCSRCMRGSIIIQVAGMNMRMCNRCWYTMEWSINNMNLESRGHSITIHHKTYLSKVLPMCSGSMLRISPQTLMYEDTVTSSMPPLFKTALCPSLTYIPFLEYTSPTRCGLFNVYIYQCLSLPACIYKASVTLVPVYRQVPILISENLEYDVGNESYASFPGLNLNVVFLNHYLTYEDSMIMSRSASMRFQYEAFVKVFQVIC